MSNKNLSAVDRPTNRTTDRTCDPTCDTGRSVTFTPRFDIWETEDAFVLSGDLPGVRAEDLQVEYDDGQVAIHGSVGVRQEARKVLHSEYEVGDFHRSFSVDETVDAEKISAEIQGGVLTIQLPKSDRVKPRRIQVTGA